jgi:hypothetical protein
MLPSLHDDYLVSYEVNCTARQIKLCARRPEWKTEPGPRTIIFDGVEGYRFENDAFGNIIFSLERVSLESFLSEHRLEIRESFHLAGALGSWAADLDSAYEVLAAKGVQAFVLSSTMGLSGWILAKVASVVPSK